MSTGMNRRAFVGSAGAAALAAGMKAGPAIAKDQFSGVDAVGQALLVRKKEVTPLELIDAAIARINAANPKVNAVVTEFFEKAREKAKGPLPASPLSGVPYLIKDLYNLTGERVTSGTRLFAHQIATKNDPITQRSIDAGLVVLGKSNTPEFGLISTTESVLLGPCRNPWKLDHSSGGSSGGAAAAVASGMMPIAHATDGGGSIRIPASACGVFGLKPSRGRMNVGPTPIPGEIAVENSVSGTVRDGAMMFSWLEDRAASAPYKPVGFVSGAAKRRLKIAFATKSYYGTEPDADVKAACEATAKLCRSLGHEIVAVENPINGGEFIAQFMTVWSSVPANLVQVAKSLKKRPEDVLEPWTLGLADMYAKKPKGALAEALAYFKKTEARVADFMTKYDVWLTPVLSSAAPKLGAQAPTVPFDTLYERVISYVAYTPLHNVAGTPAMSVPLGMNEDGLPIGSQFAAARGGEAVLFQLAYEIEKAEPWAGRKPPLFVG